MIFDRINAWVIRRLPSRRFAIDIGLADTGLQVRNREGEERRIAWEDIDEVVATRSDQLVGNTLLLLFALNDGRTLTVTEDTPVWLDLITQLPKHLRGAKPYENWALPAAFSNGTPRVEVFRR
jgi:hypothetical protein